MSTRQIDIAVLSLIVVVVLCGIVGLHQAALGAALLLEITGVGLFIFTFATRLIAAQSANQDGPAGRIDIALIAILVGVVVLGITSHDIVDAKGKMIEPGMGLLSSLGIAVVVGLLSALFFLIAFGMKVAGSMHPHAEQDFTSLPPSEERSFLPHEQYMQNNTRRAARIGIGVTGGVFVVFAAIIFGLYTPCSAYCSRPPGSCTTDKEKADFMASCESSCGRLRDERGNDFIDALSGCAFSATTEGKCEEATKAATAAGLWCAAKP